jgi:hypothetical protein
MTEIYYTEEFLRRYRELPLPVWIYRYLLTR